jgi:Zn-dependent metalloprotease
VHPHFVPVKAEGGPALAEWDARVTRMLQSGQLQLRETASDALIKGRTYQRLSQIYNGVPVFGGDLTRSLQGGRPVAVYGALYGDIDVETEPGLTAEEASEIFAHMSGDAGPAPVAELMVLPTDDGTYLLTYRARVPVSNDVHQTFIDATSGDTVLAFSDLRKPAR